MNSFATERKLFLIAALLFVLEFELGTVVAYQLDLSDPLIGGSSRDHWMTAGTPLSASGVFMLPSILFLLLAFRQHWIGIIGIAGLTLLALIAGLSWIPNHGMVQRVLTQHLTLWTSVPLAMLALLTPAIVLLGILALLRERAAWRSSAVGRVEQAPLLVEEISPARSGHEEVC